MMQSLGEWVGFAPTVVITVLLLGVPGAVLGWALRLRGWWLAAAAAPLSVSLITVASIIAGWLSIPWSILPLLGLTAIAVVSAFAWMRWAGRPGALRPPHRSDARRRWSAAIAVLVPAMTIGIILLRGMGEPSRIAQRYDNFFHLNALQYVLDTQNASPFWVGSMTAPGNLLFYPSGWHAVGSLIAQLSGSGVPAASNALVLVVAAFVWPLSIILLTRTLFGASSAVTVAAGALAAASPAFPYLPLHYGTLYPLFLGLALAPVGIAAAIRALRPGRVSRRHDRILLVVLVIPGMAVAHPGALLGMLALSVPAVAVLGWWLWRAHPGFRSRLWVAVGAVLVAAAGVAVLYFVRPPASEIYWPVTGSLATAIGEVVSAAVYGYPVAYLLAALVLIGAAAAVRRPTLRRGIALGMALVGSVLYVVVAGSPHEVLRTWLSGPWYNNAPRLASIWAISVLPLAAAGLTVAGRWLARRLAPGARARLRVMAGVPLLLVMAVVVVLATQGSAMKQATADINYVYGDGEGTDGPILSDGEYRLLSELDSLVPQGAVVAGDPWTGTSFAYGLSGTPVLMPHLLMDETGPAEVINTEFAQKGDSAAVCAALRQTGVTYILDFDGGPFMEHTEDFTGVEQLANSPFVELIAEEPGARLYQVTSCGLKK